MHKGKILSVFIVAFIVTLIIRVFVVEGFIVIGDSMAPAIKNGEYVFINKLAFTRGEPKRGDVVIVNPRGENKKLVKRIIGLPGERFSIEDGKVIIRTGRLDDGEILVESYLEKEQISSTTGISLITLDPKEYFAMGDNRSVSIDSRELGPIDIWDIEGKVIGSFNLVHLSYKGF